MGLSQSPVGTNEYVETMNSICTMGRAFGWYLMAYQLQVGK